jgi:hypothetical protein
MTDKNYERLLPLFELKNQIALVNLPERLLIEARRCKNPKKAALWVQKALAIDILLIAPMRLRNLQRLDLDTHFFYAGKGRRGKAKLVVNPHEVKNRSTYLGSMIVGSPAR